MTRLVRGMIIDVNLDPILGSETGKIRPCVVVTNNVYNERVPVIQVVPITDWSAKKARIKTNIEVHPSAENGLSKKSIADCLQTRPIDHRHRLVKIRGQLSPEELKDMDEALKIVFDLV
ncbi:type II toxin-antitoxin system PemK/MazF family toxin [Desulfoferrobacter suflitae]|uniref:type II toxin-antitoxin system PemK/MazF family toxin n=1 Tax=Desulfoferrobacter suflitae TaxID=2865782 RepID=UPI002164167E|nr:type II toxin-antitoxin system PemK/MazF family toxin [Desulfoferrobacter suflitae]MCK8603914.1 type II toxin-antitoxin system PemK/MazF family toxin [Desulfoferrobacter suflitae]